MKRLLPFVLVVLVAAACASGSGKVATVPTAAGPDLQTFTAMLEPSIYDHATPDPASPAELAGRADLVVSARLQSVATGPSYVTSVKTFQYALVAAQVTQVHKGTLPADSNGTVYVGFDNPGLPPDLLNSLLPKGTLAVLYLTVWDLKSAAAYYPAIQNVDAGRPAGQPLFADARTGLGFIVALDDRSTLRANDDYVYAAPLSEYLPDKTAWPSDAGRRPMTVNRTLSPASP